MIDITSFQRTRNVITTADFLLLHNLPSSLEPARGKFDPLVGHLPPTATYFQIPNSEYDGSVTRVDRMPTGHDVMTQNAKTTGFGAKVRDAMGGSLTEDWEEMKKRLSWTGEDRELEEKLAEVGAYPLWTWRGV